MDPILLDKWIADEENFIESKKRRKLRQSAVPAILRVWREDRGVSLREMARITGLSAGFLSQMERGNNSFAPSIRVLKAYKDNL